MQEHHYFVCGYTVSEASRLRAAAEEIEVYESIDLMLDRLEKQKIIWLTLPAGEVTENIVQELMNQLSSDDIIIEAGNSYYKDSVRRAKAAKEKGIHYIDCGTSGGQSGARTGPCLLVGGDQVVCQELEPFFKSIAYENGNLYCGNSGSGHYVKTVHNAIEYGMMEAIGEGFHLLEASDYPFDLAAIANVFNNGSVIRSWLIQLAHDALVEDSNLEQIRGIVGSTPDAKWAVQEAMDKGISVPIIANSLFIRNDSQMEDIFSIKVVAALRNGFGGHGVVKK
ncbi:6-phosphogluconate dehydrogenase (decarboxylating) [Oceanobacillus arenosus]|uniref:6-phosphogluconate dehydrogenase (Decarboxylating) n=1 Tax=Oceanobacillus arenosus TaxID=1229153 RepID=A0A3D8Q0A6_9BACI|nr:6-phosphogluconate dehydrogenase (decarboxylating) [Oceanobacillus arenosus]